MISIQKEYIYEIFDDKKDDQSDDFIIEDDEILELPDINDNKEIDDELDIDEDDEIILTEIVNNDDKKTFNYLTKYEQCYILGLRVQQIMNGSPIFIDVNKINHDLHKNKIIEEIAYLELIEKKIPFKIKRKLPNGNIEIWNLDDLNIL
jgi:DNA-directed RNA polymerase I, II, and III subunit RPABC2